MTDSISGRHGAASIGPPTAAYLQRLVRAITADEHAPTTIRNACHRLILVINTNNLALIRESLEELQQTAATEGYPLQT